MAVFRSLTFDGINSMDAGVFITGEAVYNAPAREIEMVPIPGRNGDLAIDQGRYENIDITYPAGAYGSDQPGFAEKIRKFRNELASRYSYVRLIDEYHPDEYRLAVFKDGLEVNPTSYSQAGEFNITFNCKPQRFLLSGEEPIDLYQKEVLTDHNLIPITTETGAEFELNSMGGTVINPTLNESKPLIIAPKSGSVRIGNQNITIGGDGKDKIYIDTDSMEIYKVNSAGAREPAGDLVIFEPNAFPVIPPGEVSFASSISEIEIIPRWWIL